MAKTSDRELELDIRSVLLSTGHVEPLKIEVNGNKVEILCREIPDRGKMWLKDVWGLLHESAPTEIDLHLCKRYLLKNGSMVFGWHIGIESKNARNLKKDIDWFCAAMKRVLAGQTTMVPTTTTVVSQPSPSPTKPAGTVIDPNFADDMDVRREAATARTTASPRTPEYAPDPPVAATKPKMTMVEDGTMTDSSGKTMRVQVVEMPLPFVYTNDMNKPNEKGGGAKGGLK
jgi:hypothetical protein